MNVLHDFMLRLQYCLSLSSVTLCAMDTPCIFSDQTPSALLSSSASCLVVHSNVSMFFNLLFLLILKGSSLRSQKKYLQSLLPKNSICLFSVSVSSVISVTLLIFSRAKDERLCYLHCLLILCDAVVTLSWI